MNSLSTLYQPHKHDYPIHDLNLPFSDYITQCRNLIANTRIDLQSNTDNVIDANSPFELQPTTSNQKGILLIHGLLDTPFIMRDIGEQLRQQGYLVRAILLPGHGTVPGDLLNVTYQDWIQSVTYGIASFKNQVKQLYLCGFSTGASLALYHALHQTNIAGLVLLCPAIRIRSRFDFSSNFHQLISWKWERAKWLHLVEENDYAKYQSIPFNAAYQVYQLTQVVKKLSQSMQHHCRLLFILSLADSTVSAQASIAYFQKYLKPDDHLLLYTKGTQHQHDPNTMIRTSVYPQLNIQEFSHIAIPVSPNNPHYGNHGDYINASRIKETNEIIYGSFSRIENMIYDFLYHYKITTQQRKRLSYNPDFDFMMQEIVCFLDR